MVPYGQTYGSALAVVAAEGALVDLVVFERSAAQQAGLFSVKKLPGDNIAVAVVGGDLSLVECRHGCCFS